MTANTVIGGHQAKWDDSTEMWLLSDSNIPINKHIKCVSCGMEASVDGHDACIRNVPGVVHACCGHGDPRAAYVILVGGKRLDGDLAVDYISDARRN